MLVSDHGPADDGYAQIDLLARPHNYRSLNLPDCNGNVASHTVLEGDR